jgi:hypothetical protein
MNKILAMFGCLVFVLVFGGCGQQSGKISSQPQMKSETGKDAFPEFLVGVWEVKTGQCVTKWGIKFEPDGSVLKIIYTADGPVYLAEGESYGEAGESEGAYYVFTVGPCEARYVPETRILKVKIVMDHVLQLSFGDLEGEVYDYFEGPVSKDGKTWDAKWFHSLWFKKFKDESPPDFNTIEGDLIKLVFTKTDIK